MMNKNFIKVISIAILIANSVTIPVKAESNETTDMYRLYNPYSGEHFYTSSVTERNALTHIGWRNEGVGWVAPVKSNTPVYRMYNPYTGDHHYTMSEEEKSGMVRAGWRFEGVGWYSDDQKRVPLYRQFNPYAKVGSHNYTTSEMENESLVIQGWKAEGTAWYGVARGEEYCHNLTNTFGDFTGAFYVRRIDGGMSKRDGFYELNVRVCDSNIYSVIGTELGTATIRISENAKVNWQDYEGRNRVITLENYAWYYADPSRMMRSYSRLGSVNFMNMDMIRLWQNIKYNSQGYITEFRDGVFN